MSEKDDLLNMWDRELQTTLKVLRAYPAHRENFKPHEKSKTAKELVLTFVGEQMIADGALAGKISFEPSGNMPENIKDAIAVLEKTCKEVMDKVKKTSEEELNKTVKFPIGPQKMGDFRKIDVLWTTVMDMIHHRGQFSVYLRLADAKVPSIYGPSADEPW